MIDDTEHNGYSKHVTRLDIIKQALWCFAARLTPGGAPQLALTTARCAWQYSPRTASLSTVPGRATA
ncbi:hypothetical protein [Streptomyces sp. NPDC056191]|uniref:hypothetical protein n=1 Tax=Streptomyces sp. NPDC056191 TaxID=3345742 RepID=UPI0035E3B3F8